MYTYTDYIHTYIHIHYMDQMKKEGSVHPTPKTVQKNVGFNPTPKTVQKNVGFNPTSIGVGFNPTPKKL